MTHLGQYVRDARLACGMNPQQLAVAVGYRNANKGANRILRLEDEGTCHPDLLAKITRALTLDPEAVERTRAADARELAEAFERWADEPVEPELLTPHIGCPVSRAAP